jgi:hypothetical protein
MPRGSGQPVTNDDYDTVALYLYRCDDGDLGLSVDDIARRLNPPRTELALKMRVQNVAAAAGEKVAWRHYAARTKRVHESLRDKSCEELPVRVRKILRLS